MIWHSAFGPAPSNPTAGRCGGWLGAAYEDRADPGVESYDPRPEWYFFFLFELLRIFTNPNLILFGDDHHPDDLDGAADRMPFLDRRPERRALARPDRRGYRRAPCRACSCTLTWKGSVAPAVPGRPSRRPAQRPVQRTAARPATRSRRRAWTGNIGPNLDNAQPTYQRRAGLESPTAAAACPRSRDRLDRAEDPVHGRLRRDVRGWRRATPAGARRTATSDYPASAAGRRATVGGARGERTRRAPA